MSALLATIPSGHCVLSLWMCIGPTSPRQVCSSKINVTFWVTWSFVGGYPQTCRCGFRPNVLLWCALCGRVWLGCGSPLCTKYWLIPCISLPLNPSWVGRQADGSCHCDGISCKKFALGILVHAPTMVYLWTSWTDPNVTFDLDLKHIKSLKF